MNIENETAIKLGEIDLDFAWIYEHIWFNLKSGSASTLFEYRWHREQKIFKQSVEKLNTIIEMNEYKRRMDSLKDNPLLDHSDMDLKCYIDTIENNFKELIELYNKNEDDARESLERRKRILEKNNINYEVIELT